MVAVAIYNEVVSAVTDLLDKADAGELTRDQLLDHLAALPWKKGPAIPLSDDSGVLSDEEIEGTWDELFSAYARGGLKAGERSEVRRRYDRLHTAASA